MALEPALASCSSFPCREGFRHRFVSLAPCCRPSPSRHGLGKWVQSPEPSSSRANALPRAHGAAEPPARGRWRRWHRAGRQSSGCRGPGADVPSARSFFPGARVREFLRAHGVCCFSFSPLFFFFSSERYCGFHFFFFFFTKPNLFFFSLFAFFPCYKALPFTQRDD